MYASNHYMLVIVLLFGPLIVPHLSIIALYMYGVIHHTEILIKYQILVRLFSGKGTHEQQRNAQYSFVLWLLKMSLGIWCAARNTRFPTLIEVHEHASVLQKRYQYIVRRSIVQCMQGGA
jgi:hypothetical protein